MIAGDRLRRFFADQPFAPGVTAAGRISPGAEANGLGFHPDGAPIHQLPGSRNLRVRILAAASARPADGNSPTPSFLKCRQKSAVLHRR